MYVCIVVELMCQTVSSVLVLRAVVVTLYCYATNSGVLFQYHIHTLGHVKSFREDWENVIAPLYNITSAFDDDLGIHTTAINHPTKTGLDRCCRHSYIHTYIHTYQWSYPPIRQVVCMIVYLLRALFLFKDVLKYVMYVNVYM